VFAFSVRIVLLMSCAFIPAGALQASAQPVNRALLIGASQYPKLEANRQLEGPENDVTRVRALLLEGRLAKFHEANITVLAGWPTATARRPTRGNIEREFRRLAAVAGPGDQIVILMSGYGSQQETDYDAAVKETDGLDEVFLPADVESQVNMPGRIRNAIADDEIAEWLAAIRAKEAFVWVLFDTCHSGAPTGGTERERGIPWNELMMESTIGPVARITGRRGLPAPPPGSTRFDIGNDSGGVVAMYAAPSAQPTTELRLPQGKQDAAWHGLFTYTVVEILSQAREPITYRAVMDRVRERYRALGRVNEGPDVEGVDANRLVLGPASPARSSVR
jgi:hypothetical protein